MTVDRSLTSHHWVESDYVAVTSSKEPTKSEEGPSAQHCREIRLKICFAATSALIRVNHAQFGVWVILARPAQFGVWLPRAPKGTEETQWSSVSVLFGLVWFFIEVFSPSQGSAQLVVMLREALPVWLVVLQLLVCHVEGASSTGGVSSSSDLLPVVINTWPFVDANKKCILCMRQCACV